MTLWRRWLLAAGVVLAPVLIWSFRLDLARFAAIRVLEQAGVAPVELTLRRVDFSGLRAEAISLYGGAVMAEALELAYSPRHLAAGLVDAVTIVRPRGIVALGGAGSDIMLGGRPLSLPASNVPSSGVGLRVANVRIIEADLSIDTPSGRLATRFSTDLALSGADISSQGLTLDGTLPGVGDVHLVVPSVSVASPAEGGVKLIFDRVALQSSSLPFAMEEVAGAVTWKDGTLAASIASAQVRSTQNPAVIVPLVVTAEASMAGSQVRFSLQAVADAMGAKGQIALKLSGQHDRASGVGRADIAAPRVVFQKAALQPRHFFPALGAGVPKLAGSAALSGSVGWHGGVVAPALVLHLADLAYDSDTASVSHVQGDIAFVSLQPLGTAPAQSLTGVVNAGGLPAAQAALRFQLLTKPGLRVEALDLNWIGGRIGTSPFVIEPLNPSVDTTIAFHQIDLDAFLKLAGVDGLSGSGRIDGVLPLKVSNGGAVISAGRLAASGPGVLQYRGDGLPKQITDAGASMNLVLQALADFHYDTLALEVDRAAQGDGRITLRLQGHNPAVLEGRAFNINIQLETNLDRLVGIAMSTLAATQALLRQTAGSVRP